jgi:hypothetical protein
MIMTKKPETPRVTEEPLDDDELNEDLNDAYETPFIEVSLEEMEEENELRRREHELEIDGPIDTQHGDGSAYYAYEAIKQGLVYTPPDDPPVIPGNGFQDAEMAAGFGQSMEEEDDPRGEEMPAQFANSDYDLEEKINAALRKNSETSTFTDIQVDVEDGVVYLSGQVETLDDVDILVTVIRDLDGVVDVEENLEVELI